MWFEDISEIMYHKCKIDDRKEYWENITDNYYIYLYCRNIRDRKELAETMTNSEWIYLYLQYTYNKERLKK